ncbi:M14 family zinc carboxypeptidase [bacterium]
MSIFIRNMNYHTQAGLEKELNEAVGGAAVPVEIVTLGHSEENRPISGVCFGDGDYRKPEVLYYALTHSMEYVGAEAALDIVKKLSDKNVPARLKNALDRMNVWVIPVMNPDGYASVEKMLSTGLGLAIGRKNANGVDLNRNFPVGFYHMPRSVFAGSPVKMSPHYRGGSPCSEAEAQVFRDFILGRNIKISLDFHSFGACILFPYHHTKKKCRDHDTLMRLGEGIARMQERPYTVKPSWNMYFANGDIDDWLYDECNVLPLAVEIGKLGVDLRRPETLVNPFYWANPMEPRAELDNVVEPALSLIDAACKMYAPESGGREEVF